MASTRARTPLKAAGRAYPDESGRSAGVRARAPLRLGLAGGGTDLSPYCDQWGGAVLNATVDRFAFAHVTPAPGGRLIFRASDMGQEERFERGATPPPPSEGLVLHRAVHSRFVRDGHLDPDLGLTISTTSDAPAGSGLGSSSALVVAMVEALRAALELPLSRYELARLAYEIERVDLGLAGGRQDQYAAAFGGVNFIEFLPGGQVIVNPMRVGRAELNELESAMVVCFSGRSRRSETIISQQIGGLDSANRQTLAAMHRLKDEALAMKFAVLEGDIAEVGRILNASWAAKQRTAEGISTPEIERLFSVGRAHGATGGKVSGAGGGGFLMFCTDPENRYRLVSALNAAGGQASSVKFTFDGAEAWALRG